MAHIERVFKIEGAHVAVATILRGLKGAKAGDKLAFYAEQTWTCDTSEAVKGEMALLCLETWKPGEQSMDGFYTPGTTFEQARGKRLPGIPFYAIAVAGRGRMPLVKSMEGHNFIERPVSTTFPDSIPILWNKNKRGDKQPLARLDDVEKAVQSLLAHPGETALKTKDIPE